VAHAFQAVLLEPAIGAWTPVAGITDGHFFRKVNRGGQAQGRGLLPPQLEFRPRRCDATRRRARSSLQFAVIVAVSAVSVVQMAIHQVIDVISMRYCRVATVRTVHVRLLMSDAVMVWGAFLRINRAYLNAVIVHVIAMRMM
jgi:hypothetical protein